MVAVPVRTPDEDDRFEEDRARIRSARSAHAILLAVFQSIERGGITPVSSRAAPAFPEKDSFRPQLEVHAVATRETKHPADLGGDSEPTPRRESRLAQGFVPYVGHDDKHIRLPDGTVSPANDIP
jgi:hypothetical protein